jgi:catechol 2,3-dioxygenase
MSHAPRTTLSIGKVTLTVHDLDAVKAFYQQAVGLQLLASDSSSATLGVGATVLLELRRDSAAQRRSQRDAGLFHTAFLLPTRADLGRWIKRAAETHLPIQGASDHLVSEAIYLADPEGNGIEIYADRPRSTWKWANGEVAMATEALDVENLLESAGTRNWQGLPESASIGHVHLQVGALAAAEKFYAGDLGFDITCHYPGAIFFSTGGYHHHLATNIWNSRGAPVRHQPSTGLADVEIVADNPKILDALRSSVTGAAVSSDMPSSLSIRDPWGTSMTFIAKADDPALSQVGETGRAQ